MHKRQITATVASALLLAGCSQNPTAGNAPPPARSVTDPALSSRPVDAGSLLDSIGLAGMGAVDVIDHLDRLGTDERPSDLMASVRPGELQLTSGTETASLPVPDDRFYLSVAPYVDQTHVCFYHSLTTCTGELAEEDVAVEIVDEASGEVLVDETRTTYANGFVGFWLPRDVEATLTVSHDGRSARTDISTGPEAPTCLTSLKLT